MDKRMDKEKHFLSSLKTFITMLVAGQMAVFSSFEKADLQINE